jgi:hypothetical protein
MNPQSQVEKWLKSGNRITVLLALRLFGTTELRRIVSRLPFKVDSVWRKENKKKV